MTKEDYFKSEALDMRIAKYFGWLYLLKDGFRYSILGRTQKGRTTNFYQNGYPYSMHSDIFTKTITVILIKEYLKVDCGLDNSINANLLKTISEQYPQAITDTDNFRTTLIYQKIKENLAQSF